MCCVDRQVYQPLLQALHDLALCTAAGLPRGCGEGIRQLKQQIQQETVDGSTLPPEGATYCYQLAATPRSTLACAAAAGPVMAVCADCMLLPSSAMPFGKPLVP